MSSLLSKLETMSPESGRIIKEDATTCNKGDLLEQILAAIGGAGGGYETVWLKNIAANKINPATNEKLEELKIVLELIENNTDDLETILNRIDDNTDGIETLITSTNSKIDDVNTNLGIIDGKLDDAITELGTVIDGQDILVNYNISDIDDNNEDYNYYGFLNSSGNYYIQRYDVVNSNYRYFKGATNYSTNWTNRDLLSYDYFNNIF